MLPAILDHVEIERRQARLILHGVDQPHLRGDAGAGETVGKGKRQPLVVAIGHHDFESERAAARAIAQRRAVDLVAGGFEKRERLAQRRAVAAGAVADRRRPGAVEHVGANRIREGRQQRALFLIRRTVIGGQFAVIEKARAAAIQIVEKIAVDPFEIEQQRNRLPHADVGKNRPPRVEDEVGCEFGQAVGKRFLDDAAVAGGGKVITGLPAAGIGLAAHVIETGLEGLEIGLPSR